MLCWKSPRVTWMLPSTVCTLLREKLTRVTYHEKLTPCCAKNRCCKLSRAAQPLNRTAMHQTYPTKVMVQEGGINSSRQRVRMRVAIVTSRRKKHAGSKWFRKWRRRLGKTPTFQADFLHSFTFQVFYVWIQKIDYNPSFWRGKWLITVG